MRPEKFPGHTGIFSGRELLPVMSGRIPDQTGENLDCRSSKRPPSAVASHPRSGHRASNQVDPQHVVVFAAGVALCVPALLTVKLVHMESAVCGALIGVAVMLNVLAVGTVIVTV